MNTPITSTSSSTADLGDRGIIAPDKLADLAVIEDTFIPKVVMTIKSGRPIYSGSTCFFNYEQ